MSSSRPNSKHKDGISSNARDGPSPEDQTEMGLLSLFNELPQEFSDPFKNNYRSELVEDMNAQQFLLNLMCLSDHLPEEHLFQSLLECNVPALKTTESKSPPHAQATSSYEPMSSPTFIRQTYSMNPIASSFSSLLFDGNLQFALPEQVNDSIPITTLSSFTQYYTPISPDHFSAKDNEVLIDSLLGHGNSTKVTAQPFPYAQYRATNSPHDSTYMEGMEDQLNSARGSLRTCSSPISSSAPSLAPPVRIFAADLNHSANVSDAKFATKSLHDGSNIIVTPFLHAGLPHSQYQQTVSSLAGIRRNIHIEPQNVQSSPTYDIPPTQSPSHHLTADCSIAGGEDMKSFIAQSHHDEFTYSLYPQQSTHIELPERLLHFPHVVPNNASTSHVYTSTLEHSPSTNVTDFNFPLIHNHHNDMSSLSIDANRLHPLSHISDQLDHFLRNSQLATNPFSRDAYVRKLSDMLSFTQSRLELITNQYVDDTFVRDCIRKKVAVLEDLVEQNSIDRRQVANELIESVDEGPSGKGPPGPPEIWHDAYHILTSAPGSKTVKSEPTDIGSNNAPTRLTRRGRRKRLTGEDGLETPKKERKNYTAAQKAVLMNFWFSKQGSLPTSEDRDKLMNATGLGTTQVMTWFQNSRRRKMEDLAQYNKLRARGKVWDWETYDEWVKSCKEHKPKTRVRHARRLEE